MNKQEIQIMIDNLMKEGLTRGQAVARLKKIFLTRLLFAADGSKAEERFLNDLDLLYEVLLDR